MSLRSLKETLREWNYIPICYSEFDREFITADYSEVLCCIIDYRLNFIDGISVIKFMKKIYPNLKSILISGYSIDNTVFTGEQKHFDFFIPKPLNINKLNFFLNNINKEEL